ncbi:MAG TPA: hypothetical protein VFE53_22365 [Mucilaginibacter sp.]|nr:hypothetical protein [Mucilaginibacter sp.]
MKKIVPLILVVLLPFAAFSQQAYKLDLNHIATISFPDTPRLELSSGQRVYTLTHGDSLYIACATPINRFLGLFGSALNNSFYTGVIKGTLKQSHGKLLYRRSIQMNNINGVEFAYKAVFDSVNYYCYHQAFNVKSTLVFYGYWSRDSLQNDDKKMRAFFGSFKLTDSQPAGPRTSVAYKMGFALGIILIVGVIILVGIGIVFLIRRLTKS